MDACFKCVTDAVLKQMGVVIVGHVVVATLENTMVLAKVLARRIKRMTLHHERQDGINHGGQPPFQPQFQSES